ncbi:hypothetical protein [Paracoccus pacificus]|uniref:Uncharacterized protein n=1 Tax=Paracoccus pacificus TaxID=1463598 RepID=A0ABW4R9C9_9RHOB
MAFIRLILLVILIQLVLYLLLSVYIRSLRREALEKEWAARHPENPDATEKRDLFVEKAMVGFNKTLRMRLVGLVLILPMVAVIVIAYIVNVQ